MAIIRKNLKRLQDADVRFISLVDRAATRMPFRVLKRDKESKMGIDLTRVFKSDKSDKSSVKPHVSALVVFAQKSDDAAKQIADAIEKHGFAINRVQKADAGETLVYAQGDQPENVHVVRLSDQTLVNVAGLQVPEGWLGDLVEEHGFFPNLNMAHAAMGEHLQEAVLKSDTPQKDAEAVLASYAQYLTQMAVLPTNVFKLDDAIVEIVKKCGCADDSTKDKTVKESPEEKEKRVKDHPPAEMAPPDEEDDQKPPPEEVEKSEVLKALKGIESTMATFATKLDTVATEQAEQKKALDGVVQKADTLSQTLKTTVTAAPTTEDRLALGARMRVQKSDDDPRTGNFDTAFLRRRR